MGLRLVTPPSVEPITVSDVKLDLRIVHADDDALLAKYITYAREFIEARVQFKIAEAVWEFVIDEFPAAEIKFPISPVSGVVSVKYDDPDGVVQTIAPANYYLDTTSPEQWLFPVSSWPATLDGINAVRIQFTAGYSQATVPGPVAAAVRLKVTELYEGGDNHKPVHDLLTNYYTMVA
jgi:uncharacterized phiE125 gp8 family phage protein